MDSALKRKILELLDRHRLMSVATLRPDGWPQATTVGYVNEGLTLYFLCGPDSQKAQNLARDDRLSLTIDHDTADIMAITGLSMAARATAVQDRAEAEKVLRMFPLKYPDMFKAATLMLLNKVDLLPYLTFDVAQCIEYARRVNPAIEVMQVSATKGDGMDTWLAWVKLHLVTARHARVQPKAIAAE